MNGLESPDGTIDTSALWQVLQELEAGSLDPQKRDELMALVERSPAAQRAYLEYFEMAAMLEAEAATHAEQGKLPVVADALRPWRMFRRSLLAAAALVAIGTIVAALVVVKFPEPGCLTAAATDDARWMVDGLAQSPAAAEWKVTAGSTVQVWSGTVKLRLDSGAAMVMQGPAKASFPKLNKPVLSDGWLWIDSGGSGESFEVDTPNLLVRDIGTRFGVRVPEKGPAEVHLVKGKVEVLAKSTRKMIATLEPEGRGLAIAATGKPAALALARDPFPELAELLAAPGNYPTTVRSQNPAGYWRLDETEAGALDNEIPGGLVGRRNPVVAASEPGPGPAGGFHGFAGDNHAVHLPGISDEGFLSLGATRMQTGVLVRDDFGGDGATPLVGTPADVGGTWAGASDTLMRADGSLFTPSPDQERVAYQAFSLVTGGIYTLSAEVTVAAGASDFIGIGFAGSPRDGVGPVWSDARPHAWIYLNGKAEFGVTRFTGVGLGGPAKIGDTVFDRPVTLKVVLDTSNPENYRATWFVDGVDKGSEFIGTPALDHVFIVVHRSMGRIGKFLLTCERAPAADPGRHLAAAPARVARKEGAVSFWMRREPGVKRREILWAAGENMADDAIHARLDADGRVAFFMEDGRYDLLITSEETIADGRWHHLAASWSPTAVNLYLDGQRAGSDTEYRAMQQGILPELRFGSGPAGFGDPSFTGWIDEVALWDRALTPAEVRHQFHSARGK